MKQNDYSCVRDASYWETEPVICSFSCVVLVIYNLYYLRFTQNSWVNLLLLNIHKQLLRLRSELKNHQPSRSCLFSFVALIFPLKDRQVSWFISSFFLHPWRQLVNRARCSLFYLCWPLEIMWRWDFLLWMSEYIYHGLKQNVVW